MVETITDTIKMKIQTFSVIVGSNACNAHCPFCVSRMTPNALEAKPTEVNWRNFDVAVRLACRAGVTTAMLTGKGEPTLWPDLIDKYLYEMNKDKIKNPNKLKAGVKIVIPVE